MALSQTILEGDPIPTWARYAVVVCHSHLRSERPARDAVQVFSSRGQCEAFARAMSRHFPGRTGDDLTLWALVYALAPWRDRAGFTFGSLNVCYLAFDPGGVVVKRHPIPRGYGYPAPKPRDQACACCPPGGW